MTPPDDLHDLNTQRDAFISKVAHDLRNPIAAIIGYASLVADDSLSDDQALFLERINQTAHKLHDYADQLVDLAWIEAGMPFDRLPVHLVDVVAAAIENATAAAEQRGISLRVAVEGELPPIIGDANRLRQLFSSLLDNAILFSADAQLVEVRAWHEGEAILCAVTDHGIGIAPDEMDMIFDRLYRSRDPRVQAIPGGGMGLALARRIAQRHDGDLWAVSQPDAGSTFTFRLPSG